MADRWMTYAELGDALGCSPAAARARAKRRGWRRQPGNDGVARVLVPDGEDLAPLRPPPVQRTGPESAPGTDPGPLEREAELLVKLDRLQAEMTELARKLGTAEGALQAVTGERDR